ncbi:DNA repair protein RecN [Gottschalkia acidurici 9a]|uniref:DNA repair protein RecN n=1 Tax=Gottschalkia acidurici (strain ATCC 7906 / DSM 604 / BCRC 14475 / CIP 104303 / KCTC 5404 / NCIMB 10678 / 9a) TaxID=1128398 RepID=K0B0I1_GOTA9|nr:DNA repair protein RecN [Gottschalkia acidurici]AFS78400.1 DNA repair protein RecN [Gottschalkia acidurici 9a]
MLLELNIQNFAIIEKAKISFTEGLNIITGETGTGKSIIVDAINLVLGGRADRNYIKDGEEKTIVEALFYIEKKSLVTDILNKYGIEIETDDSVLITREIHLGGKSVSRVNGRTVTLSMLIEITSKLIDIQGQHENQSLLNTENHITFVDLLGDDQFKVLKDKVKVEYAKLIALKNNLRNLIKNEREREREIDLLKFQIEEIDEFELEKDEEDYLMKKYDIMSNTQEISTTINNINEQLNSSNYNKSSVIDQLRSISIMLNKVSQYDQELKRYGESIETICYTIEDISKEIRDYQNNIEFNFETFIELENRISGLNKLKRKYGNTIEDILKYREDIFEELQILLNLEEEIKRINENIENVENNLDKYCHNLTNERKKICMKLEKNISNELNQLNMENTIFKVNIRELEYFSESGKDNVEFFISTNIGQQLKPLSKVASGGEMSRIILSFKNILAELDNINSLIFDEIDTGISGRTAQTVGEKIAQISKSHQVICITHLPQIAVMADTHFLINKELIENKTLTKIKKLNEEEQIDEICRLIGGVSVTEITKKHAKEMIKLSKHIKNNCY